MNMSDKDIAIRVDQLSKRYRIGIQEKIHDSLGGAVLDLIRSPIKNYFKYRSLYDFRDVETPEKDEAYTKIHGIIWALREVSFEIKQGEVVGIIGSNGAGKSTLLKILARITLPTGGSAEIRGRVGSLLEVGTGFHPELTGRENIYLNGTVLGMRKKEVDNKFDEIVDFSGVEKFLDTPVKRYSSGMRVRLAFAVAAHLEPEVLIIDEVLAVGDVAFQQKCLGKMGEVATQGRTVLFVSHNMGAVSELCGRAIWLDQGRGRLDGPAADIVSEYLSYGIKRHEVWICPEPEKRGSDLALVSARVLSAAHDATTIVDFDKPFNIEIAYDVVHPLRGASIAIRLLDAIGNILWTSWDADSAQWNVLVREVGTYTSTCQIPGKLLRPGQYHLSLGVIIGHVKRWYQKVLTFDVSPQGYRINMNRAGILTPSLDWAIKPAEDAKLLGSHG
jgi:lipopolysaccharide transport system ATP-binding protein